MPDKIGQSLTQERLKRGESLEKIARQLHLDPIAFRLKNALRPGELHPFSTAWSEGREPRPEGCRVHPAGTRTAGR